MSPSTTSWELLFSTSVWFALELFSEQNVHFDANVDCGTSATAVAETSQHDSPMALAKAACIARVVITSTK